MRTYKTSEIADIIGIHPNTVRLYEEWKLIPKPERKANGYRVYTDVHLEQMRFARIALKGEVMQNGIRKRAVNIIRTSAAGCYEAAIEMTREYIEKIAEEKNRAEEAIEIVSNMLAESDRAEEPLQLTRKQTADYLKLTIDTLRNWEMNGLLTIKRKDNGYRVYNRNDILRLKIISSLRCANYSLTAILRMLNDLSASSRFDIKSSINIPKETEYIISVCDRLLTSLENLEQDAKQMLRQLEYMKSKFKQNPPL